MHAFGLSRYVRLSRATSATPSSEFKARSYIAHCVNVKLADATIREAVNEMADFLLIQELTQGTLGTCCAYYSADTATPYSPLDLLRSAVAAAVAADETAIAVVASSATTPRLLPYRGIKKKSEPFRNGRFPPPLPTRGASRIAISRRRRVESRACSI